MKIAIGSDHRGFELKAELIAWLKSLGHEVTDSGTHTDEPCDYPDIAYAVAQDVSSGRVDTGILLCMSGIGMAITANKVKGIRAGLCHSARIAQLSREHNNANILVLGTAESTDPAKDIIETFLATDFEGGRHERRVQKITDIEAKA